MSPNGSVEQKCVLIIGIGSPHGDDRIGWGVIERLAASFVFIQNSSDSRVILRKAAVPHEILDWLAADLVVHIIDTARGQSLPIERYRILSGQDGILQCQLDRRHPLSAVSSAVPPMDAIANPGTALTNLFETLSSKSSHQLDLISTLELASVLGRTPSQMFLWTIAVEASAGQFERSSTAEKSVQECASQISIHINSSLNAPTGSL